MPQNAMPWQRGSDSSICSSRPAHSASLTVPDGYGPGMQLTIQHPTTGAQVPVTIPNGVGPGQKFEVRLA